MNDETQRGSAALVTGASAGIGQEFARQLAQRGLNVILVARRLDRLEKLGQQLALTFGVRWRAVSADLTEPAAVDTLVEEAADTQWPISWLINNAGIGLPGKFLATDWDAHDAFLRLMMTHPLKLAHAILPDMRRRGYGRVVNVASLAGLVPQSAGHTLYGATKAFLIRSSESLHAEYAPRGVNVCATCPGFTYSEFHDVAGTREQVSQMPSVLWQQPAPVVTESLRAVDAGKPFVVTGKVNKAIAAAMKWLPYPLAARIVAGRAHQFRKID